MIDFLAIDKKGNPHYVIVKQSDIISVVQDLKSTETIVTLRCKWNGKDKRIVTAEEPESILEKLRQPFFRRTKKDE